MTSLGLPSLQNRKWQHREMINKYGWQFLEDLTINVPCDEHIKFHFRRTLFSCTLRAGVHQSRGALSPTPDWIVDAGALHIFNIIIAVFFLMHKNVYQFTRTEQKAPDYSVADGSLQNCGSAILHTKHLYQFTRTEQKRQITVRLTGHCRTGGPQFWPCIKSPSWRQELGGDA